MLAYPALLLRCFQFKLPLRLSLLGSLLLALLVPLRLRVLNSVSHLPTHASMERLWLATWLSCFSCTCLSCQDQVRVLHIFTSVSFRLLAAYENGASDEVGNQAEVKMTQRAHEQTAHRAVVILP